ncbi:hypothetical protein [Variovorax sp. UMC13]|uniref:hypothetical protein n=1 Tax=Variovorax sp. UMC13 TaxID=1862326 RepID=UPI001601DF53|nr:hypothetical protein [Variovorax sp. UMC13]
MTKPTVAGPRMSPSREVYTGAELATRSPRPGAYDALALPSRMGDTQVPPGGARVSLPSMRERQPVALMHRVAPAPPPAPPQAAAKRPPAAQLTPAGRVAAEWQPRANSVPSRVLTALRAPGAPKYFTHREISDQFGLPLKQVLASFSTPIEKEVLQRVHVNGQHAISLPGFVPPAVAPAPAKVAAAPDPSASKTAAELQRISAHARALAAALDELKCQALDLGHEIEKAAQALSRALHSIPAPFNPLGRARP